jgi:chromosome partitioning protein
VFCEHFNEIYKHTPREAVVIQGVELANILGVKPQQITNIRSRYNLIDGIDTVTLSNNRRYYTPDGIRKILQKRNYDFIKRKICVCNVKGGVGKTTISVNIARKAASFGFKTLLVDCDKQANATDQIWPEGNQKTFPSLYDLVKKTVRAEDTIIKIDDYLSLLPSNLKNQLLEIEITNTNINKGNYFKRLLDKFDYDIVIFDTEPNLSQINLMALAYSDLNIAPIRLDKNSIDGLELLLTFIEDQLNEWPEMNTTTRVLINGFDKRMTTEAIKKIGEVQSLGIDTFNTAVRIDQSFVKAQDLREIKKNSKAYEDITLLLAELIELSPSNQLTQ